MAIIHHPTDTNWRADYKVFEKQVRDDASKLNVIIVGAGLGGMGAAIGLLLAGHEVTVLEAAPAIGEVGAGIQVLPNSARVLCNWGLRDRLEKFASRPRQCNYWSWKGKHLSTMNFHKYTEALGGPFWDFHRANLHRGLLERAVELGCKVVTDAKVDDWCVLPSGEGASLTLHNGKKMECDLLVGADGINSRMREVFLGREDPPKLTGDLAYRLLLDTSQMMDDPDLRQFIEDPQTNYWIGPDKHIVNYVLNGGKQFNMVLLVPDDMPAGASTLKGNIEEMRALFEDWDPRIGKLLKLCNSVLKWRLCIREDLDGGWVDPSGAFTMLGDSVHATLPYLASGAGMALEDGGVLGLSLGRLKDKSPASKAAALKVYEKCRKERTARVVERGSHNQYMYHLHDGEEQRARDARYTKYDQLDEEWFASEKPPRVPVSQETGDDPFVWRRNGVGRWLLTYNMAEDVDEHWAKMVGTQA